MRRMALLIAASLVVASATSAIAAPKATAAAKRSKTADRAKSSNKGTTKQCASSSKGKRACKRVAVFQGHAASKSGFVTEPLAKPTGNIWLYAENLNEEVKV